MHCQFAFHPPLRKSQYDATVLCFGSSVTIKWQPTQSETKKLIPTKFHQKLGTIQCLFLFKLFLWKCQIFTILVVLKGSRLKRLRYGIHTHLRCKINFLHVPLHVPWEMSRIVDLQFKVRPCWLGHVGTQKPKKDTSFRKSPYNLLSRNICSIFFQHQVPHCHTSQNDFIMSLKIISDIFLDSQSAMLLPLDPHNVIYVMSICFPPSVAEKPIWCNCSLFWVQCHHKMATNSKLFPFMYPGKCLGLWTYNLRSVHVDLDT